MSILLKYTGFRKRITIAKKKKERKTTWQIKTAGGEGSNKSSKTSKV